MRTLKKLMALPRVRPRSWLSAAAASSSFLVGDLVLEQLWQACSSSLISHMSADLGAMSSDTLILCHWPSTDPLVLEWPVQRIRIS